MVVVVVVVAAAVVVEVEVVMMQVMLVEALGFLGGGVPAAGISNGGALSHRAETTFPCI